MDFVETNEPFSKRHPWEVVRGEFFLKLLQRTGLLEGGSDWLGAGAGDALVRATASSPSCFPATGTCWDINYTSDDIEAYSTSGTEELGFVADRPTRRFDRVPMLDVIEHVEDDVGFVAATAARQWCAAMLVVLGGTVPPDDADELKALDVAEVSGPGATTSEIVDFLRGAIAV